MKFYTILLHILSLTCYSIISFGQIDTTSKWKRALETGLNVNQATFSENWKGGGVSSLAIGSLFNGRAFYKDNRISFDNDLQLAYGFLKNSGQDFRKNIDKIFFDTKLGYQTAPKWNLFAAINFISQFAPGYEYKKDTNDVEYGVKISQFMAPGFLTSTLGFEYKPVPYFWSRFGIGSIRQTFVLDTTIYKSVPQNYGVPIGEKVRNEMAFMLTLNFDKDIAKNVHLLTRFTAFANYQTLDAIDTKLDVVLTAKVNKFINVNLTGVVLYDQDMDYKIQYSEALSLGILYQFSEFKK